MFIRKLFKIGDKAKWLTLELLIVFIGVYLAFLFQGYAEDNKVNKEREKVLVSLKLELETFRISFPGFANYQQGKVNEWDSLFDEKKATDYYRWRYLEPQYNSRVIEYALNQEGTDIIGFSLYEELSKLFGTIKQLEHAERLMTEYAGRYKFDQNKFKEDSPQKLAREADNRFSFYKFIGFARDRARSMETIANESSQILKRLNEQLGLKKTREVEVKLFERYIQAGAEEDYLVRIQKEYFPDYSSEEFDTIIQEIRSQKANENF